MVALSKNKNGANQAVKNKKGGGETDGGQTRRQRKTFRSSSQRLWEINVFKFVEFWVELRELRRIHYEIPREPLEAGQPRIANPMWLAISSDFSMRVDVQDHVNAMLESHSATAQIPDELMAGILENCVVVCPDRKTQKEFYEWLHWARGQSVVPCFVEVVPVTLPKKSTGSKSSGKGSSSSVTGRTVD